MPITLCRVDDRLIHGQVVIGWGTPLGVDRIVLVDDVIRASPWEQDIYRMAVPPSVALEFLTPEEAARRVGAWESGPERVFILTGDVETMTRLVEAADGRLAAVNLGGLHERAGRRERLRYLFLSDEEVDRLRRLEARGVRITAQDLPSARAVPLGELV